MATHQAALDENFPDPFVLRTPEGYHAYGTETPGSANVNLARSHDLLSWERLGDAMPDKPSWLGGRRFLWAPHVVVRESLYHLFFSGQVAEGDPWPVFGLGLAVSESPAGPFIDVGAPLTQGEAFRDIDPMVFEDPGSGKTYLYYGSGWHSLRAVELSPDLRSLAGQPVDILWPSEDEYETLIEASFVVKRGEWYFLFYSGDSATDPAHYAVLVAICGAKKKWWCQMARLDSIRHRESRSRSPSPRVWGGLWHPKAPVPRRIAYLPVGPFLPRGTAPWSGGDPWGGQVVTPGVVRW